MTGSTITEWRDALGQPHARASDPRIVSLVPSLTELLFELGLGDRVVGRTTFCVHPAPEVERVPRVGGTKKPRMDRLRALEPTHVLVNVDENRREDVDEIADFVPGVVVTHPVEPRDNLDLYHLVGGIFGREAEARDLRDAFSRELEATARAASQLPRRDVLYLIWRDPWMTVSRPTYISRMLDLVNWQTVADDPDTRYPEVTLDEALLGGTDLVLLSSEPFPFKPKHREQLEAGLPPGRRPRVLLIDGEYTSWYGSRAIRGLRYLRDLAAEEAG